MASHGPTARPRSLRSRRTSSQEAVDSRSPSLMATHGLTEDEIIQSYPALTGGGIRAATAYAADLARERIVMLPGRDAA